MKTKELELIEALLKSTDGENIVVIKELLPETTLKDYFGVCGKHSDYIVPPGFYVYGDSDWQICGMFEPDTMYLLADNDKKLFYFSVKYDYH